MGIGFALFVSMFALDAFGEGTGFWSAALALALHLMPTALVVGALVLAWKWEWTGAILFSALGLLYAAKALHHPDWILLISGPLFLIAALFLMGWLKRSEMRTRH